MITHAFDPIHRQNFWYYNGVSEKKLRSHFFKQFKESIPDDMKFNVDGKCLRYDHPESGYIIIIWTRKRNDLYSLVHEIVHAASYSLLPRGYQFDLDQEVYSYLTAFLLREFYKIRK